MDEVDSCSCFEEVNSLPDLRHMLLSGESLCHIVVSDCASHNGVGKLNNSSSMDFYPSLLSDSANAAEFDQLDPVRSELPSDVPPVEEIDYSNKDANLSEISNSVAEEEFLYQLNLSKCDKYPTVMLNNKLPNTRNIARLKCARLNGTKSNIIKPAENKTIKKRLSFKEKISRLKSANQKQQTVLSTLKRKPQSASSKSVLTSKQRLHKAKFKKVEKSVDEVSGICSVCRWAYSSKEEKIQHMSDPKHIIMTEAKRGTNFQALREEANVFKDVTFPAKCSICNETLSRQRDFLAHHRRHAWMQPYHCVRCSSMFYRRCDLLYHLRNHLGINKTFSCKECSSTFSKESFLISHKIAKHGHPDTRPRNYKCTECNMSFVAKHAVNRHIRTHTGYSSASCSFCGKGFSNNFALQAHLRTHTGETPFKCDQCSYESKTKQLLSRHQRSHNGDKPFKCKQCSYATASTSGLKRHVLKHSGSKPFKCPYCSYRCANIENLRKHIKRTRKHVGLKIYPCQHCSFACDASVEFIKHVKQQHLPSLDEESASATKLSGILLSDPDQQSGDFSVVTSSVVSDSSLQSVQSVLKPVDGNSSVEMYLVNSNQYFVPTMETQPGNVVLATDANQRLVGFSHNSSTFENGVQQNSSSYEDGVSQTSLCADLASTEVAGLDGALLNALIKIPNLQKVILPPGDGNSPVTLIIGSEKLPLDGAVDDNCHQPSVRNGSINTTSGSQQSTITSLSDLTASSAGRQHYIISSSGIQSYKKD